jgi:hypothetical protein
MKLNSIPIKLGSKNRYTGPEVVGRVFGSPGNGTKKNRTQGRVMHPRKLKLLKCFCAVAYCWDR